jgi:multicomponent K+:H+ antiporter subunit F
MSAVLGFAILFAFACVMLAMAFCTVRLLIGPSAQDRVLALDTLWMCSMLLAIVLGIRHNSQVYFEMAMLIALVGFASTMALVKFLMRGEIIE